MWGHTVCWHPTSCVSTIWNHGDPSSPAWAGADLNAVAKCHLIPEVIPQFFRGNRYE